MGVDRGGNITGVGRGGKLAGVDRGGKLAEEKVEGGDVK